MNVPLDGQTKNESTAWMSSVASWLCLFVALAFFATVFLAPRLLTHAQLSATYYNNQVQLVELEQHGQQLDRILEALERDPEFRTELARVEFDATRPEEQRIRVGGGLSLNAIAAAPSQASSQSRLPWYTPVLEYLVSNPIYGHLLVLTAAALTLFAFIGLRAVPARG